MDQVVMVPVAEIEADPALLFDPQIVTVMVAQLVGDLVTGSDLPESA